jgi:NAD+ kinase
MRNGCHGQGRPGGAGRKGAPGLATHGRRLQSIDVSSADGSAIARIGVVVHPRREIDRPVAALREWAAAHGAELGQLAEAADGPRIAPLREAAETALVVAIGGDGTVLAALRAAAPADRPVLGVACGSLGALTTVEGGAITATLDAFAAGEWTAQHVPALLARDGAGAEWTAINDLVVVRDGGNQVAAEVEADGVLYGRFAGDGVIASTQLGSSAYALAAGGPLLAPGADAWLITPLAPHGGCVPPLVVGAGSRARLLLEPGHAGARIEVDGHATTLEPRELELRLRADFGTLVRAGEEEAFLTGLRRRNIVIDSPRMLAREARLERARVEG